MGTFGGGLAVGMSMVQPSGGGGAAIPDVTVATFADLPTTRPDGFLVAVTAEPDLSDVIVRWDDGGSVWLLDTVSMEWAYAVPLLATTSDGEWYSSGGITVNTAPGGALRITDRAGQVYLFAPAMTVAAGAGGGFRALWMLAQAASGTPTVRAYAVGTETNAALPVQGVTVVENSGATMGTTGSVLRAAMTGASRSAYLQVLTAAVATGTKYHIRCLARLTSTAAVGAAFSYMPYVNDGTNLLILGQYHGGVVSFRSTPSSNAVATQLRSSGSALPSTASAPVLVEYVDEGATVLSTVYIDGFPYGACRRNAVAAAGNFILFGASHSASVTGTTTIDVSEVLVTTY